MFNLSLIVNYHVFHSQFHVFMIFEFNKIRILQYSFKTLTILYTKTFTLVYFFKANRTYVSQTEICERVFFLATFHIR